MRITLLLCICISAWGSPLLLDACAEVEECRLATQLHPEALEALGRYIGLQTDGHTVPALLEENIRLKMQLYQACDTELGEYLTFLDKHGAPGAARCEFHSEADALRAKNAVMTVSATHPCFQEEGEVVMVVLVAILVFIVIELAFQVLDVVQRSSAVGKRTGKDVSRYFMRSDMRQ